MNTDQKSEANGTTGTEQTGGEKTAQPGAENNIKSEKGPDMSFATEEESDEALKAFDAEMEEVMKRHPKVNMLVIAATTTENKASGYVHQRGYDSSLVSSLHNYLQQNEGMNARLKLRMLEQFLSGE